MRGMNAHTGRALADIDHLQQSLSDILLTPLGSRVMRRDYGSLLPDLIDQPLNEALLLQLYAAAVMAIVQWEPRVTINQITFTPATAAGQAATLELIVTRHDTGTQSADNVAIALGAAA